MQGQSKQQLGDAVGSPDAWHLFIPPLPRLFALLRSTILRCDSSGLQEPAVAPGTMSSHNHIEKQGRNFPLSVSFKQKNLPRSPQQASLQVLLAELRNRLMPLLQKQLGNGVIGIFSLDSWSQVPHWQRRETGQTGNGHWVSESQGLGHSHCPSPQRITSTLPKVLGSSLFNLMLQKLI